MATEYQECTAFCKSFKCDCKPTTKKVESTPQLTHDVDYHGVMPKDVAKKFGNQVPEKAYIAVDPSRDDRAWFLIEGRWVLKDGFTGSLRVEIGQVRTRPAAPPPVSPPLVDVDLHVVLFE